MIDRRDPHTGAPVDPQDIREGSRPYQHGHGGEGRESPCHSGNWAGQNEEIWQEASHWFPRSRMKSEGKMVEGIAWTLPPEFFFLFLSSEKNSGSGSD